MKKAPPAARHPRFNRTFTPTVCNATDDRATGLFARQRLQDLHCVGRRHRVRCARGRNACTEFHPSRLWVRASRPAFRSSMAARSCFAWLNRLRGLQGGQACWHQFAHRPASDRRFWQLDGDLEMLQWATLGGDGRRLGLAAGAVWASSCITPMQNANTPMTGSRTLAGSTRRWTLQQ